MDKETEEKTEQVETTEAQLDLVDVRELTDGEVILQSLSADNGLPYPQSRGVFRAKLD